MNAFGPGPGIFISTHQGDASTISISYRVVSEILHLSNDSAYRRIRNETPLVLQEAKELCEHFHLSLDQLLSLKSNSVVFENIRINNEQYSYKKYLSDITELVKQISSYDRKEIIYLTKDIPLFHSFYFKPLIAFRFFSG